MPTPSISVIIPAYRAAATIERAIDSVLAQTLPATEILVVDDGSPDNQATIVEKYGPPVVMLRQKNGKTASARNAGIRQAHGDFIAFLDADDYWEPEKLERQLAVFAAHADAAIVGSRFYYQEQDGVRRINPLNAPSWCDRVHHAKGATAFQLGTLLWTGTVVVRRSVLEAERFVSGLEPAEDRDLWIRIVAEHPAYVLSEPLATAVLEPGGISRSNLERDCTKMLEVVERHRHLLSVFRRMVWRSYICYRWAALEPRPRTAIRLLMKSFLTWPAPLTGLPKMQPWGRLKRLARIVNLLVREMPLNYSKGTTL